MHVAIIMDGNGRWATERGRPRTAGHVEGAKAVRAVVETAARAGVEVLTLYAFSSDNWSRPAAEIGALMRLFGQYLFTETRRCVEQQIRLNVIGRRDRLSGSLLRSIEQSERLSAQGNGMLLRIALDYSARHGLIEAARRSPVDVDAAGFERLLAAANHASVPVGAVDLLIRTGSEQRLSDFLLWECAYAELYFTHCLWPDFGEQEFLAALRDFAGRQRRFGTVMADSRG